MDSEPAIALTIAGSDSGGAAGLQADLKTFTALSVYGMSVVTVVTAQNSRQVTAVHPLPASFVEAQLEAVLSDYGAGAIKTGFIGRVELVTLIGARLSAYSSAPLVVDPVLVNHQGMAMFPEEVSSAYRARLSPLARLMTPNAAEAALLSGVPVNSLSSARRAATAIRRQGAQAVLVTGIPAGEEIVDLLDDGELHTFRAPRINTRNTHGSGDTLSAAVTAFLAQGKELLPAIEQARLFTREAIRRAAGWELGAGHGPLAHFR